MTPKIAHFYWGGSPLPWIRAQGIESFRRLHPDWDVVLASPDENASAPEGVRLMKDDVSDPRLPIASRSDVWRWWALSEFGGVYADTDVIFIRNIEPLLRGDYRMWITSDMGTPIQSLGGRVVRGTDGRRRIQFNTSISIGMLASTLGCPFFKRLSAIARGDERSNNYQSHGTLLMVEHWAHLVEGVVVGNIPASAFYRGSSPNQVKELWGTYGVFQDHEYGVHWYGGSDESKPFLGATSAQDLPESWVRSALLQRPILA